MRSRCRVSWPCTMSYAMCRGLHCLFEMAPPASGSDALDRGLQMDGFIAMLASSSWRASLPSLWKCTSLPHGPSGEALPGSETDCDHTLQRGDPHFSFFLLQHHVSHKLAFVFVNTCNKFPLYIYTPCQDTVCVTSPCLAMERWKGFEREEGTERGRGEQNPILTSQEVPASQCVHQCLYVICVHFTGNDALGDF